MLEDRDYMRSDYRGPAPKSTQWTASVMLMGVLVVAFAFQCINDVYVRSPLELQLALTRDALGRGYLWQLFTFQFLHVSLWHLVGNLVGLWFIGRVVENALGTGRFLVAYFACGVAGGLLQAALMLIFPNHFAAFVFGASAGEMGIFAIFALLMKGSVLRLNFILPVRADVLLWISGAISLFFTLVPSARGGCMAHAAHLGGLLGGLLWVKLGWHRDYVRLPWERVISRWKGREQAGRDHRRPAPHLQVQSNTESVDSSSDSVSQSVDPILEKISKHGIHSLTERERKTLEEARKKMGKR